LANKRAGIAKRPCAPRSLRFKRSAILALKLDHQRGYALDQRGYSFNLYLLGLITQALRRELDNKITKPTGSDITAL
jgi:hypothetical protein